MVLVRKQRQGQGFRSVPVPGRPRAARPRSAPIVRAISAILDLLPCIDASQRRYARAQIAGAHRHGLSCLRRGGCLPCDGPCHGSVTPTDLEVSGD